MNIQNNLQKVRAIDRKNFFSRISKGFMGLVVLSSFPFNMLGKNSSSIKTEIKINPLAIKRKKDNRKNG